MQVVGNMKMADSLNGEVFNTPFSHSAGGCLKLEKQFGPASLAR
jgi:hypothetical protein